MRVTRQQDLDETCPKLPIHQQNHNHYRHQEIITKQQRLNKTKMKFNWRANWEILLVLVIIIVGIVITTIAAIRSKDKQHLLVLPDDAGDYGAGLSGGGTADQVSSMQVPPLPHTDFQLVQNAQVQSMTEDGEGGGGDVATSSPFAATTTTLGSSGSSVAARRPPKSAPNQGHHQGQLQPPTSSTTSRNDYMTTARKQQHGHSAPHSNSIRHIPQQSPPPPPSTSSSSGNNGAGKYDDGAPIQLNQPISSGGDYEALSTEPTPRQTLRHSPGGDSIVNQTLADFGARQGGGGGGGHKNQDRRSSANRQRPQQYEVSDHHLMSLTATSAGPSAEGDKQQQLGRLVDGQAVNELADDIHTTRSALVDSNSNNINNQNQTDDGQQMSPPPGAPTLSMHGPYELSPLVAQQHLNRQQAEFGSDRLAAVHQKLLLAQGVNSTAQQLPGPALPDSDDMMTSYSRLPQSGLTANALLRDYNLATAAFNGGVNSSSADLSGTADLLQALNNNNNNNLPTRQRTVASSLPFSMLLNDIIRLARPSQSSSSLIDAQANLDKPANSRPQFSILQQLRSLPGPILALLQGSAASASSSSQIGGHSGVGGDLTSSNNLGLASSIHDASESSPHYQRISMAPAGDMSMILSRSLRAAGGALPAYPPPKGTPQAWIPPTAGGDPAVNDAINNNADFISSNTAGFLRVPTVGSSPTNSPGTMGANSANSGGGGGGATGQQANSGQQQQQRQSSEDHLSYQQQQQSVESEQQQQLQQSQQQQLQQQQQQHQHMGPMQNVQSAPMGQARPAPNERPNLAQDDGGYRPFRQSQQQAFMQQQQQQQQQQQAYMGNYLPKMPAQQQQQQSIGNLARNSNMMQQQPQPQSPIVYNARQQTNSEILDSSLNVPLGFNPVQHQHHHHHHQPHYQHNQVQQQQQFLNQNTNLQQQQMIPSRQQQQAGSSYDFNVLPIESAPKASLATSAGPSNQQQQSSSKHQALADIPRRVTSSNGGSQSQQIQLNTVVSRQKRATASGDDVDGPDEAGEEEYLDSMPLSIVSPDGRPMSSDEVRLMRNRQVQSELGHRDSMTSGLQTDPSQVVPASSLRQVNHMDLGESAMHHYASENTSGGEGGTSRHQSSNSPQGLKQQQQVGAASVSTQQHKRRTNIKAQPEGARSHHRGRPVAIADEQDGGRQRDKKLADSGADGQAKAMEKVAKTGGKSANKTSKKPPVEDEPAKWRQAAGSAGQSQGKGPVKKKLIGKKDKGASTKQNSKAKGGALVLDTAGSGLMSKLLGTASTNDELDEDIDGDDDESGSSAANERRKEELEDAEFGINVNDDNGPQQQQQQQQQQSGDSGGGGPNDESNVDSNSDTGGGSGGSLLVPNDEVSRLTSAQDNTSSGQDSLAGDGGGNGGGSSGASSAGPDTDSGLGSGGLDSNAYASRRQHQHQRSDVEFYGHPGEETRQLKYGILGSGNYEVVNGGIYPELDESTAAVNSVANYVRRPGAGGGVLLAGLPKLLATAAGGSGGAHLHNHHHHPGAFLPGARMSPVSEGYMRGASAHPDDHPLGLTSPLLELIDAHNNGQQLGFDPGLVAAHLGSSGTSARTTFTSQEGAGHATNSGSSDHDQMEPAQMKPHHDQQQQHHHHHHLHHHHREQKRQKSSVDGDQTGGDKQADDDSMGQMMEVERDNDISNSNTNAAESEHYGSSKRQRNPLTGSKGQGTNQFFSYQILPSKKVTIFSDQDLDSGPSETQSVSIAISAQNRPATLIRDDKWPPLCNGQVASIDRQID